MKKINYKSDFDLLATMKCYDTQGKEIEIGFANYDWELDLYTGCGNYAPKVYKVSYIGGKATNCFNDNGKVHIVCDNHSLNLGVLNGTIRAKIPNAIYPDGTQLLVSPLTFAIELVADGGDTPSPIEVEIMLPYLYDSAYRIAQQSGYKGSQEEYYQLASQLPNAVETANKVQASADSLADSAEQIGGAIEALASTTDAIEQGANVIKDNADTLQESADKVSESATKVEQAVEPLVQASESLDATKQAFESLSSEWSDGRKAIATALTNRRYPTEPSESFHAMADKISNMSYEEGWFAKIGYTDDNDGGIQDAIDYSYELAKGWNPDGSTTKMFAYNTLLIFFPMIDTSNVLVATDMLRGTGILFLPNLNLDNATDFTNFLAANMRIKYIGRIKSSRGKVFNGTFHQNNSLIRLEEIDLQSATTTSNIVYQCSALIYALIKNIGKSALTTYDFGGASVWGTGGEENRQSLIDSLITYSYDRANNGMSTATIKLSATTKALLTEEEVAQITAKGFTIA